MTTNQIAWFRALNEKEHNERYDKEYYRHNTATERATIYSANLSAAMDKYRADKQAEASIYSANKSAEASMYSADKHYAGTVYSADTAAAANRYAADLHYASSIYGSDKAYEASVYNANMSLLGTKYAADAHAEATRYSANKSYAASREASKDETARQRERNLSNYNIAKLQTDTNQEIASMRAGIEAAKNLYDARMDALRLQYTQARDKANWEKDVMLSEWSNATSIVSSLIGGAGNVGSSVVRTIGMMAEFA